MGATSPPPLNSLIFWSKLRTNMSSNALTPSNDTPIIRIGFVGLSSTGWAAMALAPSLLDPEVKKRFKVVAISTTSAESAAAAASKYSEFFGHEIKAYHGDASQIASDPEVDLVAIARDSALDTMASNPDREIQVLVEDSLTGESVPQAVRPSASSSSNWLLGHTLLSYRNHIVIISTMSGLNSLLSLRR